MRYFLDYPVQTLSLKKKKRLIYLIEANYKLRINYYVYTFLTNVNLTYKNFNFSLMFVHCNAL